MKNDQIEKESSSNFQQIEQTINEIEEGKKLVKIQILEDVTSFITSKIINVLTITVKNNVLQNFINKAENLIDPYGGVDDEKIRSLINIKVYDMRKDIFGFNLYSLAINEKVFDILHVKIISTKNTNHLLKWINKEILAKKLKAKMRNDVESISIIEAFEQGFNNVE